MSEEGPFKTNDMAMATFLEMEGHTPQKIEFEGQNCFWYFLYIPSLVAAVDSFLSQTAMVTPQAYNRAFAAVKREMVDARSRRDQGRRQPRHNTI
jgi:hypothetical protein